MKSIYRGLLARPRLAAVLSAATLLINVLSFGDIIFVMLILRRYVAHGCDGTLFILTAMALGALGLQYACKEARIVLARQVGEGEDEDLARRTFAALASARVEALEALPRGDRDLPGLLAERQQGADASVVCAAMDFPFSLVFVAATAVLHPVLGLVVLVSTWMALATASRTKPRIQAVAAELREHTAGNSALVVSTAACAATVRVFRGATHYGGLWRAQVARLAALRARAANMRSLVQSSQASVSAFTRVAVYAVGALLVVKGELTFASLIGASMLASYAVAKVSLLVQARDAVGRAAQAGESVQRILDLPAEPSGGPLPEPRPGVSALSLRDAGFAFPGARAPLFRGLDLDVSHGTLVVAHGWNGSGKTTLARLAVGLIRPDQGAILVHGEPLAGAGTDAWRARLCYMPQDPEFLSATMRENLVLANPGLAEDELNAILRRTGLRAFLDTSERGLEAHMPDAGRGLPLGIRRRLALARALATGGDVAILDEPTEGLDDQGQAMVRAVVMELLAQGRAVLAMTSDRFLHNAAHVVVDLGVKPVPTVTARTPGLAGNGNGAGEERP